MSSIDDQLKLILSDLHDYHSDPDRWTQPMKKGEKTFVEQIKEAFKKAGYIRTKFEVDNEPGLHFINGVDPLKQFDGRVLMTGPEWFERFLESLNHETTDPRVRIYSETNQDVLNYRIAVMEAAKRASVLEEK